MLLALLHGRPRAGRLCSTVDRSAGSPGGRRLGWSRTSSRPPGVAGRSGRASGGHRRRRASHRGTAGCATSHRCWRRRRDRRTCRVSRRDLVSMAQRRRAVPAEAHAVRAQPDCLAPGPYAVAVDREGGSLAVRVPVKAPGRGGGIAPAHGLGRTSGGKTSGCDTRARLRSVCCPVEIGGLSG